MQRTDSHLQVHKPKTAGVFLGAVFQEALGSDVIYGGHTPAWRLTAEDVGDRVMVGTVRNPWDEYRSFYLHAKGSRDAFLAYGNGSTSFRDVLYGLTHPAEVSRHPFPVGVFWHPFLTIPAWWSLPAGSRSNLLQRYDEQLWQAVQRSGLGYWTWSTRFIYGARPVLCWTEERPWAVDLLLATDRVYEAVREVLGLHMDAESFPPRNTAEQRGDQLEEAWDEEMVGWVAEADGRLIERFGFEPGRPSPQAVYRMR